MNNLIEIDVMDFWSAMQRESLYHIYRLVLKHGWKITPGEITPEGAYILELSGENPYRNNWTEDWQFHELPTYQYRQIKLTCPPNQINGST